MADVLHQRTGCAWCRSRVLPPLLQMDRKTVARRIADANLAPTGRRDGYRSTTGAEPARRACCRRVRTVTSKSLIRACSNRWTAALGISPSASASRWKPIAGSLFQRLKFMPRWPNWSVGLSIPGHLAGCAGAQRCIAPDQIEELHAQVAKERARLHVRRLKSR